MKRAAQQAADAVDEAMSTKDFSGLSATIGGIIRHAALSALDPDGSRSGGQETKPAVPPQTAHPERFFAAPDGAEGKKILGIVGAALAVIFGLMTLGFGLLAAHVTSLMMPLAACFGAAAALGALLAVRGFRAGKKAERFRIYREMLLPRLYAGVKDLARAAGRTEAQAVEDLEGFCREGKIRQGHFDAAKSCFIASDELYLQYQAAAARDRERKEAEEAVDRLREKYQGASSEIAGLVQRETALSQQLTEAENDIETYKSAVEELQRKLRELEDEEANSSLSEEQLASRRKSAEEEMESQRNQCEGFKAERVEKNKQLREMEVELTALISRLEKQKETVERLTLEKEELVKRILDMEYEKTETETKLKGLEAEAANKELTEEEKAAVQAIMDAISATTQEKETVNAEQISLEEEKTALQETLTKSSDKRYKCEIEISKIDTTLENSRQRMEEAYELEYEGCLSMRVENFNVEEAASLISALKRKITMLGAVNPHAVEEYDEERLRCDEMVGQRDDLQKAIDDLQSALDQIREEMLRIFNAGFYDFNENFKTTFKELFGGGRAELQIDYEGVEDPLAAGVEIVACPPGKKLTKISLLSGGERALTAIAILFAILKSKPMPFCILDEIEAALDDANVDRFASYLKNFSANTQFIVITHRKPTMNQADTLFGVTMQEKGVSKIVSVKLAEVETKLGAGTVE